MKPLQSAEVAAISGLAGLGDSPELRLLLAALQLKVVEVPELLEPAHAAAAVAGLLGLGAGPERGALLKALSVQVARARLDADSLCALAPALPCLGDEAPVLAAALAEQLPGLRLTPGQVVEVLACLPGLPGAGLLDALADQLEAHPGPVTQAQLGSAAESLELLPASEAAPRLLRALSTCAARVPLRTGAALA